jgi:flagellar biogenesis protein FliO
MGAQNESIVSPSASDLLRSALRTLAKVARGRVWHRRRGLRVCEMLSLGHRGYLAVVSYRQQEFLVGGTANSIALLAQLPGETAGELKNSESGEPAG